MFCLFRGGFKILVRTNNRPRKSKTPLYMSSVRKFKFASNTNDGNKGMIGRQKQLSWHASHSQLIASTLTEDTGRSEEHTSELQSLMRISYAVFCLKKKNTHKNTKDERIPF